MTSPFQDERSEEPLLDGSESEFEDEDDYETTSVDEEGDSSTAEREKREKEEIEELIRRETRSVATWRETVTGILMIVAFVASVATFVFMGREEHNAFVTSVSKSPMQFWHDYVLRIVISGIY